VDISGINISNQAEKGDGIRVSNANYISIINNSCIGTFFGIYLTSSSECHIVGNTLIENSVGIFCYETTRVTIEENQLYNNTLSRYGTFGNGIMIDHCHSFSIDNNKCKLYDQNGIRIRFSSNNTVSNNQIRNDRNEVPWGAGILITGGKENIITGNYHENNFCALRFDGIIENNSINYNMYVSNVHGVVCYGKNYVHDNFFLDNRKGINIYGSPRLKVYNNTLTMNHIGVSIDTMAFENKIYHNVIENSTKVGIKIESTCVNNTLYQNNLINNSRQVNDMGINIWNDEKNVGNYWSNYNGSDNGSKGREACDGIGDTNLPCNDVDFYPLIEPWSRDE
jgi:parallel beta-helix repeat protein